MEAVFRPKIFRIFFPSLSAGSYRKAQEDGWNSPEKIRKFLAGILIPCYRDFRRFPAGAGPCFLTWVVCGRHMHTEWREEM